MTPTVKINSILGVFIFQVLRFYPLTKPRAHKVIG